jgi:hypothetical protein
VTSRQQLAKAQQDIAEQVAGGLLALLVQKYKY